MNFPNPTLSRDEAMDLWISERSEYAKEQVVLNNVRLIGLVLRKLNLNLLDDDLFSVGLIGLVKAVNTFNPDKGMKFSTFAARVISNEILMTFRKKRITNLLYLDEMVEIGDGDTVALADMIGDKRDFESEVISNISVKSILSNLTNRESQILYLYANEKTTQDEIARQMGLSQTSISRILKKMRGKLEKIDY